MKPKVYLESSVIGYLTGRPSRDVIVFARQQLTQSWWTNHKTQYELFVSPLVLIEIARGDANAAIERTKAISDIPILDPKEEIAALATLLLKKGSLPAKASDDALHIAWAAFYEIDYLLTWNCTHIANATTRKIIESTIREAGYLVPTICTPEELFGELK